MSLEALLLALATFFPPAGGHFTDPETNANVIRISDRTYGQHCVHAYSTWSPLNADDTRLLISCDDRPLLFRVDPATDSVSFDRHLDENIQWEGAIWSHTNPDLLYALDLRGSRLWTIDVARREKTVVHDFAHELPAGTHPAQLDASADEQIFTFHTRDRAEHKLAAYVWSAQGGLVELPLDGHAVDETKLDKRGRHVFVTFADGTRALFDLKTMRATWLSPKKQEDCVSGHYDLGADWLATDDGFVAGVCLRRITAPNAPRHAHTHLRPDGQQDWTVSDHISLREDPETFAIVSTFGPGGGAILLLPTDGRPAKKLANTFDAGVASDPAWSYFAQPRAAVDYHGRYVVWTSDLGSPDRLDVLMLRIPASASGTSR